MKFNFSRSLLTYLSTLWLLLIVAAGNASLEPNASSSTGSNAFLTPQPTVCVTTTPESQAYPAAEGFQSCYPDLSSQGYPAPNGSNRQQSTSRSPRDAATILVPVTDLDIVRHPQRFTVYGNTLYWVAALANDEVDILKTDLATFETERLNIPNEKGGFLYLRASDKYLAWYNDFSDPKMLFVFDTETSTFVLERALSAGIQRAQFDMKSDLVIWRDTQSSDLYIYDLTSAQESLLVEDIGIVWPTVCSNSWVAYTANYDSAIKSADLQLHNVQSDEQIVTGKLRQFPSPSSETPTFACDATHLAWMEDGDVKLFSIDQQTTETLTAFSGDYAPLGSHFRVDQDVVLAAVGGVGWMGYDLSSQILFDPFTEPRSSSGSTGMTHPYLVWSGETDDLVANYYIVSLAR